MKYELSIIIPAYNCESYIERCIQSIVESETSINYEILIINDGSTDNTRKICEEIEKNNKNVKLYNKKNGGVSEARNLGIKKSKGRWITFIDADDYVSSNYIDVIEKSVIKESLVICNNYCVNNEGECIINPFFPPTQNIKENIILMILFIENGIQKEIKLPSIRAIWGKIYDANIIKENNIEFAKGVRIFEDGLFNLEYLRYIDKIVFINEPIYYYIDTPKSATKKYQKDMIFEDKIKIKEINKSLVDTNIDNKRNIINSYMNNLFIDYLIIDLYHKDNKNTLKQRIASLKKIRKDKTYGQFSLRDTRLLNMKKKLIIICMKFHLYWIIEVIMYLKNKKG